MCKITIDDIKVAEKLARLELNDDERNEIRTHLERQVADFAALNDIDTDGALSDLGRAGDALPRAEER